MKQLQILIKPASSACNLRCRYCFYEDESNCREIKNYGIMSAETRSDLIENALSSAEERCVFAFQGGEPVLAGLKWFQDFAEEVNKRKIKNSRLPILFRQTERFLMITGFYFLRKIRFW